MVSVGKFGSWFLLLIVSYTLVSLVNSPRDMDARSEGMPVTAEPERDAA
jgi:uncharacterized membrane protein YoaT (DUF817 family)